MQRITGLGAQTGDVGERCFSDEAVVCFLLGLLGRSLSCLDSFPYWFYGDPSTLIFFKGL